MIEIRKKSVSDIDIINIGLFNLYKSMDDRKYFKVVINKLFVLGDEIFFFFRREEDLTDDDELKSLKNKIFSEIQDVGEFKYLSKLDDRRFDAIGRVTLNLNFSNLIIDMWKYFYACDFFLPLNDLSFEEYEDYLHTNGLNDINGIAMIQNKLTQVICIKGLGADHLIISYTSELDLDIKLKF